MTHLFGNLTCLELYIFHRDTNTSDDEDLDTYESFAYKSLFRNRTDPGPPLRQLLANMPHLKTLAIGSSHYVDDEDGIRYPASLQDVIRSGQTWRNLKRLRLEAIETDRGELVEFLARHQRSLVELTLKDMHLIHTSWLKHQACRGALSHVFGYDRMSAEHSERRVPL
ncbi:hypothetical protein B0T25DRAFT_611992 [Lasiosphaeria hispida]|uniref:Uncharacterized protein n=1 Tax=Lasiosphaeria hispida TaxID=260671 RepID=A0AAJ0HAW9_9PEZI|nr:hypothetical protein B0T25DRAFT_611992 [Lasiosphaeria hispida]